MAELLISYKFFALEPTEVQRERGNFPLESIVPYGPIHNNEIDAKGWLEEHAEPHKMYILLPIHTF